MRREALRRGGWVPPLVYAALAVAVAGPLLAPGFVLTLDLAPTPDPGIPESYWGIPEGTHVGPPARLPLDALLALFGELGAAEVAEKLLLLAIVFLAGWGMHRLVPARTPEARYFAGLLYAVNPFVFDRLVTGQWFLLLGFALLPHAYRWFLATLEEEDRRLSPWAFGALFAATGIASSHMAGLLLVLCLLTLVAWAPRIRERPQLLRLPAAGLGLALLASLYWLLPAPGVEDFWRSIGDEQLALYRSVGDEVWGLLPTLAGLSGYWNNPEPLRDHLSVWPLFALTFLVLSVWGAVLQRGRPATWGVAAAGVFGAVMALGDASWLTRDVYTFLLEEISPLRSFREPQKGVALLVFAYAFLSSGAVDDLLENPPGFRRARVVLAAGLLALPLVFGFRLLGGAWGDLETSKYPDSWSEAAEVLEEDAPASRTLFLPWHGYLVLDFADERTVRNPAPGFFSTPILASRSVGEGAGLADNSDPVEERVEDLLDRGAAVPDFSACLAPLGVTHVLLAKTADWERYGYLDRTNLTVERSWPDLVLYRSRLPAGPVMAGGGGAEAGCTAELGVLPSDRRSPVRYELEQAAPSEVVLGVPAPEDWDVDERQVSFEPWNSYRRNYLLGLAGALAFALSLWIAARRP